MQQNLPDRSHLIRLTETQKRKARRRLIGSIFLLLIALIILFKVTSNITPVEVAPKNVEIKNTSSSAKAISNNLTISSQPITTPNNNKAASAGIENSNASSTAIATPNIAATPNSNAESNVAKPAMFKPRLIVEPIKSKPLPEDILNGQTTAVVLGNKYYVQLIASSDKEKLIHFQDMLANQGIKTIIQSVDTPNGIVYRLRSGPFINKNDAINMLDTINGINDEYTNDNQ
ncbi:MAG: SPOR domain-containing protein [Burkholderiales bacterium]|nr:SPOR domain-containing protein [Burkholderiales bacterium]